MPAPLNRFLNADLAEQEARERPAYRRAASVAALLRLLGDPTRLRLLLLLADGERSVTELCRVTGIAQPTVSHHLGKLRWWSLVVTRRSGKNVYYAYGPDVAAGGDWLSVGTMRLPLGRDA
jgi:DNA-binding transcriptional ArsR family regulator